jgi:hypothetical protein
MTHAVKDNVAAEHMTGKSRITRQIQKKEFDRIRKQFNDLWASGRSEATLQQLLKSGGYTSLRCLFAGNRVT